MTSESGPPGMSEPTPEPTPPPLAPIPPAPASQGSNAMADAMSQAFSSAEGMVSLGGAVLIAGYLLFGLILNEYWVAWVTLLPAVLVVLLPRFTGDWVEKIAPMPVLLKALGYAIVILGAVAIIENLRFAGSVFDEFLAVLGALVSYVGYVIVFLGARSIKT